jgi:hypothetical protein
MIADDGTLEKTLPDIFPLTARIANKVAKPELLAQQTHLFMEHLPRLFVSCGLTISVISQEV